MKISKSITWIGAALFAVMITAGCNRTNDSSTAGTGGQESSTAGAGGGGQTTPGAGGDSAPTADAGRQMDQAQEGAGPGAQAGANITDRIDDDAITAKVQSAITGEPDLKSAKINVNTANGVVILSGAVDSPTTVDRANQIAQAIEGVKSVDNRLTVKQG